MSDFVRVLLDGKPHTHGIFDLVVLEHVEEEPDFDVTRLSVNADDAKANADDKAIKFAA